MNKDCKCSKRSKTLRWRKVWQGHWVSEQLELVSQLKILRMPWDKPTPLFPALSLNLNQWSWEKCSRILQASKIRHLPSLLDISSRGILWIAVTNMSIALGSWMGYSILLRPSWLSFLRWPPNYCIKLELALCLHSPIPCQSSQNWILPGCIEFCIPIKEMTDLEGRQFYTEPEKNSPKCGKLNSDWQKDYTLKCFIPARYERFLKVSRYERVLKVKATIELAGHSNW
jgi:hypothetical protein